MAAEEFLRRRWHLAGLHAFLGGCLLCLALAGCRGSWEPEDPAPCEGCEWVLRGDRFFSRDAFVSEGSLVFLNNESSSLWRADLGTGELERLVEGLFSSRDLAYSDGAAWLAASSWAQPLLRVDLASAEVTEFFPFGPLGRVGPVGTGPGASLVVSGASAEERLVATLLADGTMGEVFDRSHLDADLTLVDAAEEGVLWSRGTELVFRSPDGEEQVLPFQEDLLTWSFRARIAPSGVLLPEAEGMIYWDQATDELSLYNEMAGLTVVVPMPCGFLGLSESKDGFSTFDQAGRLLRSVELPTRNVQNMASDPIVVGDEAYFLGASWALKSPLGCGVEEL